MIIKETELFMALDLLKLVMFYVVILLLTRDLGGLTRKERCLSIVLASLLLGFCLFVFVLSD